MGIEEEEDKQLRYEFFSLVDGNDKDGGIINKRLSMITYPDLIGG